jgi:ABC-type amino acid transport substrate-binding protein
MACKTACKFVRKSCVAILLRREDQALQNFIDIWIDQSEMDGTLAKIHAKWLGETR